MPAKKTKKTIYKVMVRNECMSWTENYEEALNFSMMTRGSRIKICERWE